MRCYRLRNAKRKGPCRQAAEVCVTVRDSLTEQSLKQNRGVVLLRRQIESVCLFFHERSRYPSLLRLSSYEGDTAVGRARTDASCGITIVILAHQRIATLKLQPNFFDEHQERKAESHSGSGP